MTSLIDLLGQNLSSPEVAKRLADYPGLKPEAGGDVMDRGVDPVKYLRSTRDGLLIKLSEEGEILAIFFMSDGKDGSAEFRGELPGKLNFAAEPEDALRALGKPAWRRPEATFGGQRLGELLRYDMPAYSLHIQFRADHDGIDLVTAMAARLVPGRSRA